MKSMLISRPCFGPKTGSVLLLVLITVAMMSLTAGSYLVLMENEYTATRYSGRRLQARMLVESGAEYLLALLEQSDEELEQQGGIADNPELLQSVLVIDDTMAGYRGRFTVLSNNMDRGYYDELRYGLENESAKLNINTLVEDDDEDNNTARERLLAIPGMDSSIADSILDWLDEDNIPREFGAERSYYEELSPGYEPRNGPFTALDELLLVKGISPELLYGLDTNRSYLVDSQEAEARGALLELENLEGEMNRGLSAYLTIHSMERLENPEGKKKTNISIANLKRLYNRLRKVISEDEAKFMVAYRQYGPASEGATGESTSLGDLKLDWKKEAETEITSLLELVGARVSVPGKKKNPAQILESPWQDDPATYREDFLELLDYVQVDEATRIAGRVNLLEASRPVLMSIPGATEIMVDQILNQRNSETKLANEEARHAIWILAEGIVTLEEMKQISPYVSVSGDVYSAQIVGYFEETTPRSRAEIILDRSGNVSRIASWQDLTQLGPGVARSVLGDELSDKK